MGFSNVAQAALGRLKTFYNGDPYGAQNQGGMDNDGHRLNFIPSLRDLALVGGECATLVDQAAAAAQMAMDAASGSPKAIRVDKAQDFTTGEKETGRANLGLTDVLTAFVKKTGDALTGSLTITSGDARLMLTQNGGTYDKKGWNLLNFSGDGQLYFQDMTNGAYISNAVQFSRAGKIVTAELGDLSTRIENRALAYASARLALTGGALTGALSAPNIIMTGTDASIQMGSRNAKTVYTVYNFDDVWRVYNNTANLDMFRVANDGSLWTSQLGDLNNRIEIRASAIADNRLTTARSEYLYRSGGIMTGDLVLNGGYARLELRASSSNGFPYLDWANEGKANVDYTWRMMTYGNTNDGFQFINYAGASVLTLQQDGSIVTNQFGDLNSRIEARGLAYQQAAQGTSVQKTGDQMTGNLIMNATAAGGSVGTRYIMPNNADWLVRAIGGNQLQFCDGAVTVQYFSFGTDGKFWTRELGDLAANVVFPGALLFSAAPNPPAGYLRCNGASLSRATYPRLFSAIGGTYGAADGNSFSLPDVRGYFLRPLDEGRGADPAGGGRAIGSYQGSDNLWHSHGLSNGSGSIITAGSGANVGSGPYLGIGSLQGSGGNEARPQNLAFPVYIKY